MPHRCCQGREPAMSPSRPGSTTDKRLRCWRRHVRAVQLKYTTEVEGWQAPPAAGHAVHDIGCQLFQRCTDLSAYRPMAGSPSKAQMCEHACPDGAELQECASKGPDPAPLQPPDDVRQSGCIAPRAVDAFGGPRSARLGHWSCGGLALWTHTACCGKRRAIICTRWAGCGQFESADQSVDKPKPDTRTWCA